MTEVQRRVSAATVRAYRPTDHRACRGLWAELIRHRSELYGQPVGRRGAQPSLDGGETETVVDPGAGFEEYLTRLDLSGLWVADTSDDGDGVVGFVGLVLDGDSGGVDPVVVTMSQRGRGIGRALLTRVAEEARRRGLARLTVSPSVRDLATLRSLHGAGFATIANVTLTFETGVMSTRGGNGSAAASALELYDLHFDV